MCASHGCSMTGELASYERAVPRELSPYTYPARWLWSNGECWSESFRYIMDHRDLPGIRVVLGTGDPHGDQAGPWAVDQVLDEDFWLGAEEEDTQ